MATPELNILTYNVTRDFATQPRFIDRLIEDINNIQPVIGGLQEVTRETYNYMNNRWNNFGNYKIVMCEVEDTCIMSFVFPIIDIKAVCWDSFVMKDGTYTPFQILICSCLGKDILIVNCSFPEIEPELIDKIIVKKLSENLNKGFEFPTDADEEQAAFQGILDHNFNKTDITHLIKGKKFKIVLMGDFKDKDKLKLYLGFRPFQTRFNKAFDGFTKEEKKKVNNIKTAVFHHPPKTCCFEYDKVNDEFSGKKTDDQMRYIGDYVLVDRSFEIIQGNHIPPTAETRIAGNFLKPHTITSLHFPSVLKVKFKLDDKSPSSEAMEEAFKSFSSSLESSNSRFESVSGDNQPTALKFKCEKESFNSPKVKKEKPKKGDKKKTDKKKGDKKGDKKGKEKKSKKKKKSS